MLQKCEQYQHNILNPQKAQMKMTRTNSTPLKQKMHK